MVIVRQPTVSGDVVIGSAGDEADRSLGPDQRGTDRAERAVSSDDENPAVPRLGFLARPFPCVDIRRDLQNLHAIAKAQAKPWLELSRQPATSTRVQDNRDIFH